MKINIVLTLVFVVSIQFLAAQTTTIKGIVLDSLSQNPVQYASVSVVNAKHLPVQGVITDKDGKFLLKGDRSQIAGLIIKYLGYKQKTIYKLKLEKKLLDLGVIPLIKSEQALNEVVVVGSVAQSNHQIDRQVFKASQYQTAVGGTALDIVKNLPAANVDGQGNISVRGSSGIMVLVNDKPVFVDPVTILNQIAANDVLDVEFITNPSAKYDPDGKSGILNIKTKKATTNGLSWILNLQGGLPSIKDYDNKEPQKRFGGDLSVYYQKDKFDLSASLNYLRNDNAGFREGDVYTIIQDKKTSFPSSGERSFDKYNYGLRLNSSYAFSTDHSISIGVLASRKFQDRLADIHYNNKATDVGSGNTLYEVNYFNSNLQNKQGEFYLVDLLYKFKLNRSRFQIGGIYEHANIYGDTYNRNIFRGTDTVQWSQNGYHNPLNGLRLNFMHEIEIGKGKLASGYQLRNDRQNGEFTYQVSNENGPIISDPEFSGRLKTNNLIHAVFSQYDWKKEAISFNVGLRYEYYKRQLDLIHTGEKFPYSIHQLYPSASLLYDLGSGFSWKASASRRVQRTNNFELNPIPEREHSETLEQGDPELLPEFISNAETGLVKKLKQGSLFTNLYFQHIKNPIQRVNAVYADTILNRVFTNADYATRWGIEVGGETQIVPGLQFTGGLNVYQYHVEGLLFSDAEKRENNDWVYSLNATLQARFLSTWNISASTNYLSKRPTVQGWDSRFLTPNLSLKKSFYKNALSVQLQWQNIELGNWGVNEQRITTSAADFYTTTNYIYEKNVLLLQLSFNLHQLNQLIKLPKSEFGEKEF